MRPRVFPAEDPEVFIGPNVLNIASMRPRVFPAEDARVAGERVAGRRVVASMRPRVFPAEDTNPALPQIDPEREGLQ